jgi:cyanophycin synthetase
MLYPDDHSARIPLVAVTGTNGKTTTTRLVAHIAKNAGHKVGFTTTDGIYIQDQCVHYGDCTGFRSADAVLHDPTIDFAVLECARGGILRSGLGFDHCNISIITNVSEDHLGLKDIDTLNDMARVKGVVAKSTFDDGYSILNADDDLVYDMRNDLDCKIGLFSTQATNARVLDHCSKGGLASIIEKGYLVICEGEWKHRICKVSEIPLSFSGKATCMIKNLLPAALAGFILNFKIDDIRKSLMSFIPSPEFTPGRMNIFNLRDITIMVDYAHNPGGFNEMKQFLDNSEYTRKIGVITGVGDRRDEDITRIGHISAQIFDEIIIRHDDDLRGRTPDGIDTLLIDGIRSAGLNIPIKVIPEEEKALEYAIEHASMGSIIILCSENVRRTIDLVRSVQKKEKNYSLADAK